MSISGELNIFPVKSVPGLFISDRLSPNSTPTLSSLNIRHILCISRSRDVPKFKFPDSSANSRHYFIIRQHQVSNTSTEDILYHLKTGCDWIDLKLQPRSEADLIDDLTCPGVLIHSPGGIHIAGTCVVAYLMDRFSLNYSAALALARESHALVSPNPGFELQLRIWGYCNYDILTSFNTVGKPVGEEKLAYVSWKKYRDELLRKGEDCTARARFGMMAKMAAAVGKRKATRNSNEDTQQELARNQGGTNPSTAKMWDNVEQMEAEWTRRLVSGGSSR